MTMKLMKSSLILTAAVLISFSGAAQERYFTVVGDDLSNLSASMIEVKEGAIFSNASKLFSEFASKSKTLNETDFNEFAKKHYVFAGEDPDDSVAFAYDNFSQISDHDIKLVLESDDLTHLMVEIKYDDGETYLLREDLECNSSSCKYSMEETPQGFERLYSNFLNAYENNSLEAKIEGNRIAKIQNSGVYYRQKKETNNSLEASFLKAYKSYYDSVEMLNLLPTEEEYNVAFAKFMGFERDSRDDNFLSISWESSEGEVVYSDFLTYADMIKALGNEPIIRDYFDGKNGIVYFLLSPKDNTSDLYPVAFDSKAGTIVNGLRNSGYRQLVNPKILKALSNTY